MPSSSWACEEHVVPQPRLEMALHLGQVEIRARAAARQCRVVVGEVQREVEQASRTPARRRPARAFPAGASRAAAPSASPVARRGGSPCRWPDRAKLIVRCTASLRLTWPCTMFSQVGVAGVLEIGHEGLRRGIQRVDDHLAVDRTGDLHAAVLQIGRHRRDAPVARADRARVLGRKSGSAPASSSAWRLHRAASSSSRRGLKRRCRCDQEAQGPVVSTSPARSTPGR